MEKSNEIRYKIAEYDHEFEEIFRLNYETFVEEITQHQPNTERRLVDKFHNENTYIIALNSQNELVGMVSIRGVRPFSLDYKIDNLDKYLPAKSIPCEIRLLAVRKKYRSTSVARKLIEQAGIEALKLGYEIGLISGIVERLPMYKKIGFVPFGDIVGKEGAYFQPMIINFDAFDSFVHRETEIQQLNLMPGPVCVSKDVTFAFQQPPISHRSVEFRKILDTLKFSLCNLVNCNKLQVFTGAGTLANDMVAGQLKQLEGVGLILINGEFGKRLINNAKGLHLDFMTLSWEWGQPFDLEEIEETIKTNEEISWIWFVHCETSTGFLNPMNELIDLCEKHDLKLAADCISTIGTIPLNLSKIFMASATSGKALASYAGIAIVFYNHELKQPKFSLPAFLDLFLYEKYDGIPYTIPTNLIIALHKAVEILNVKEKEKNIESLSVWLQQGFTALGFKLLLPQNYMHKPVITIVLPEEISSEKFGDELNKKNIQISYKSGYLIERNWVQICLMGHYEHSHVAPLMNEMKELKNLLLN